MPTSRHEGRNVLTCPGCGFEAPDDFAFRPRCATKRAASPGIPEERKLVTTKLPVEQNVLSSGHALPTQHRGEYEAAAAGFVDAAALAAARGIFRRLRATPALAETDAVLARFAAAGTS